MQFLKKKNKSPQDLVRATCEAVLTLERKKGDPKGAEKVLEDISKLVLAMKNVLYGDGEAEANQEIANQLAVEIDRSDLLYILIASLPRFEFEAKKDVAQVFNNLLRRPPGGPSPAVAHIERSPKIFDTLVDGYEDPNIALNCGSMLRECIRQESLCRILLGSPNFFKFFKFVEMSNFDGASDAFATFKELLTRHKLLAAEFLEKNFTEVFDAYTGLLNSQNYVTRRQSLKLLGELLLDRSNFSVMTRFIGSPANLKQMMNLLRDRSRSIQLEAFHVFKLFVANPKKPQPIVDILVKNRDKLIQFLTNFRNDKTEDDQFADDKAVLIREITSLANR